MPVRDVFTCSELPVLEDKAQLGEIVQSNEITDVIDMTNRSCVHKVVEEAELQENLKEYLPSDVNVFTPIFTTPTDIKRHRRGHQSQRSPILPGVVYPF